MALLIMLNNWSHDLATAAFAICAMTSWLLVRSPVARQAPQAFAEVSARLGYIGWGAFAWILLAGAVRALAYREFEWSEAAGRAQIWVLAVKHVLLVGFTVLGLTSMRLAARRREALKTGS